MSYSDRLRKCKLPTLHYRRIRGDMIEMFKILTGKYDRAAIPDMHGADYSVTRGHSLRLSKCRCKYGLRKYYFCNAQC